MGFIGCLHLSDAYKVAYFNAQKLFAKLKNSKADGTYYNLISKITRQDLLIIDDFGLHILDDIDRLALLEIMEDRYGIKSTLVSSQLPVKVWFDIIGESTIADAILDRLVNGSFRIEIKSKKSLRE